MKNKISLQPQLRVDLNAVKKNYQLLKKLTTPAECAAVVKDNAYGLGVFEIAKTLYESGCKTFFVSYVFEGIELRKLFDDVTIFLLQGIAEEEIPFIKQFRLIPVISTLDDLVLWEKQGDKNTKPAIQIETGLNRLGLHPEEIQTDVFKKALKNTEISLILSHLSCATESNHFMNHQQLSQFQQWIESLPKAPLSLSASDGIFLGKTFHYDMVRAGAALYGINTAPYRQNQMEPVVYIKATILKVFSVPDDQYVGYGATYRTYGNRKIATLSIGYGDGLPRYLQNKGKIWFEDENAHRYFAPIVGAISMDMLSCDVSHIPEHLVVPGKTGSIIDAYYTIDDLAKDAHTIGYECLTRLGHRFKRIHV